MARITLAVFISYIKIAHNNYATQLQYPHHSTDSMSSAH